MPPRIPPQSIPSSLTASSPAHASRVQCVYQNRQRALPFSNSARQHAKAGPINKHTPNSERGELRQRQRDDLYAFLNGPLGSKLRQPAKGSTNYLSAYNIRGDLVRTLKPQVKKGNTDMPQSEAASNGLPAESENDLRPYPQNSYFHSQAVLSEELRTEIWRRVTELKEPIKMVSSSFGVSIERVAAVVRMKEMEQNWQEEVSTRTPFPRRCRDTLMISPSCIRLVLKTNSMVIHVVYLSDSSSRRCWLRCSNLHHELTLYTRANHWPRHIRVQSSKCSQRPRSFKNLKTDLFMSPSTTSTFIQLQKHKFSILSPNHDSSHEKMLVMPLTQPCCLQRNASHTQRWSRSVAGS